MAEAAEVQQLTSAQTTKVLDRARERLKYAESKEKDNRDSQKTDTEFVYVPGKQWDDVTKAKRTSWGELCLEFPQLKQFVNQVVNDQRQNRPGIRIHPASGDASKEVADILQGMIRGIEYDSRAESVYDCGYQGSVVGGRGYWRITAEHTSPDSFDQKLVLKRIPDPLSVYLDPDFQDPDGGDRNWGYVFESVHKDEFEERWPDADPLNFQGGEKLWYPDDDHVVVADYYERVCTTKELLALRNGTIGYRDELEKQFGPIPPEAILRKRKTEVYKVNWYTIAGGDQIVETHEWPGTIIPIVCTMGDEIMVDGKRIFQGLITQAKSSQAMFNYGMTNQAIHLALTPRAPWVAAAGQIEGYEKIWNSANERNWSVLPYKPVTIEGTLVGAPQRQPPSTPDAGWINWTQQMTGLMRSTVGMYENSLGMRGQEVSGRAIKAREMQGDNATFHYADNLGRAICLTGRIIVECIPYYYDAQRIVHIVAEDDTRREVTINQQTAGTPDPMTGAIEALVKNNVKVGKYAVTVASGPGYETKRQEMADLTMQLVAADKTGLLAQSAMDIIVKIQDIPEADILAKRVRALLPPPVQAVIAAEEAGQDPKIAAMQQQMQQAKQQSDQMIQGLQQQLGTISNQLEQIKNDKSASIAASNARESAATVQGQRAQAQGQNDAAQMQSDERMAVMKHMGEQENRAIQRDKVFVDFMSVLMKALQPPPVVDAEAQTAQRELGDNQ